MHLYRAGSISSQGTASGQRRRLYSAVPGRVFVATRSHSAQGDREISFNKGDKVKGEWVCVSLCEHALCESICVYFSKSAIKCLFVSVCFSQVWINVVCVCILVICVGMSVYVCLRAMSTCMRVCVCVFNSRVHHSVYICHHSLHICMFLNELVNA